MFHKKKPVKSVRIEIDFQPRISRWFIFRFLWIPVIMVQIAVYAIWFGILSFIHFFYMLVLGERSASIFVKQLRFINFAGRWQAYLKYYVNDHPSVLPWREL